MCDDIPRVNSCLNVSIMILILIINLKFFMDCVFLFPELKFDCLSVHYLWKRENIICPALSVDRSSSLRQSRMTRSTFLSLSSIISPLCLMGFWLMPNGENIWGVIEIPLIPRRVGKMNEKCLIFNADCNMLMFYHLLFAINIYSFVEREVNLRGRHVFIRYQSK